MHPGRAFRAAAVVVVCAAGAAGCATADRRAEFRDFAAGRYDAARVQYEMHAAEGGAEATLDRCLAGTAALAAGDVRGAHAHFRDAFDDLESLTATTGETAAAILGPESSKRWKGDPHERCMNAWYTGVTYWLLGDPDNAAACFRTGLLRDADSAKGAAQSDFGAMWYALGMAQRAASHEDRGEQAFARAHDILPSNPYADPAVARAANVFLVVEAGLAPRKVAAGAHGSEVAFQRRNYVVAGADVSEGGRSLGAVAPAADLLVQAVTRGDKTLDDVNRAKAAAKDAAVIGGAVLADNAGNSRNRAIGVGLIALGVLLPAEADVRQWDTLPGEIHVFAAKLPPGEHVLRVEPRDGSGRPVAGTARDLRITVRERGVAFAWMRAGPAPVAVGAR